MWIFRHFSRDWFIKYRETSCVKPEGGDGHDFKAGGKAADDGSGTAAECSKCPQQEAEK